MKVIYRDLIMLNNVLGRCSSSKDFSAEAMIKLIDLKDELQKTVDKYTKIFGELMNQHGVKEENGNYNWEGNKEADVITKRVGEILDAECNIKNLQFLDAVQFVNMVPEGLTLSDISFLSKFLRKVSSTTEAEVIHMDESSNGIRGGKNKKAIKNN